MPINWKPTKWIDDLIEQRMLKAGDAMVAMAKALAPEDTGFLKSKIYATYLASSKTLTLHADAPWSLYQEFGTFRHKPHPYLRPALNAFAPAFLTGKLAGVRTQIMAGTYSDVDQAPRRIQPHIRPHISAANRMHNTGATKRSELTAVHHDRKGNVRTHRVGLKQEPKVMLSSLTKRRVNTRNDAWN